ncbi:MAG: hypothetical protein HY372_00655 [Candidatus Andersenbacteria bacterium]|nr:hypothetical protein [Candidatus Andersenbacteria bacterium]
MSARDWSNFYRHGLTVSLAGSVIVNAALWAAVFTLFPHGEPAAILHYSIDVGIDFIGAGQQIIMLPAIGAALAVGNTVLGAALSRAQPATAKLLWYTTPLLQIILLGSFILIWQANR